MIFNEIFVKFILLIIFILKIETFSCCIIIDTEQLEHNLCRTKECPNYSKCTINENRLIPECNCQTECEINDYIDMLTEPLKNHKPKMDDIICGTDGKDYENFCQLRQISCKQNKEIKIAHIGKCGLLQLKFIIFF
jgi:hypothetical protein